MTDNLRVNLEDLVRAVQADTRYLISPTARERCLTQAHTLASLANAMTQILRDGGNQQSAEYTFISHEVWEQSVEFLAAFAAANGYGTTEDAMAFEQVL